MKSLTINTENVGHFGMYLKLEYMIIVQVSSWKLLFDIIYAKEILETQDL